MTIIKFLIKLPQLFHLGILHSSRYVVCLLYHLVLLFVFCCLYDVVFLTVFVPCEWMLCIFYVRSVYKCNRMLKYNTITAIYVNGYQNFKTGHTELSSVNRPVKIKIFPRNISVEGLQIICYCYKRRLEAS
jgi:hypothetical protein